MYFGRFFCHSKAYIDTGSRIYNESTLNINISKSHYQNDFKKPRLGVKDESDEESLGAIAALLNQQEGVPKMWI